MLRSTSGVRLGDDKVPSVIIRRRQTRQNQDKHVKCQAGRKAVVERLRTTGLVIVSNAPSSSLGQLSSSLTTRMGDIPVASTSDSVVISSAAVWFQSRL